MITKIINSYDIHVNTQQMRIIDKNELKVQPEGFDVRRLLLNEPRGSKYVNLLIYEVTDSCIKVEIDTFSTADNIEIMLRALVSSLRDRHTLPYKDVYHVITGGQVYLIKNSELNSVVLPEPVEKNGVFSVNESSIVIEETLMDLSVLNINGIKEAVKESRHREYDYYVFKGKTHHVTVNSDQIIIAYPVLEVISTLHQVYGETKMTTLTGLTIHADKTLEFEYFLISNSQFYLDDTDIYRQGFIIK